MSEPGAVATGLLQPASQNPVAIALGSDLIEAAAADDAAIADLESELKMKRDVRDDKYVALNENRSKVGLGVACSAAYGNDSPL